LCQFPSDCSEAVHSNGYCLVVCFTVASQQRVYVLCYNNNKTVKAIPVRGSWAHKMVTCQGSHISKDIRPI
jgi:hypothetical protein